MASYWSMNETHQILGVKTNYQVYKKIRENLINRAMIKEGKYYIVSDEWINHYQEKILQDNINTILWHYHYGNNLINCFRLIILSGKASEFTISFQNIEIRLSCLKVEDIITDFNISVTNACFTNFPAIEVKLKELLLNRLMLEYSVKLTTVISFETKNARFILPPQTKTYYSNHPNNFRAVIRYYGRTYTMDSIREVKEFLNSNYIYD